MMTDPGIVSMLAYLSTLGNLAIIALIVLLCVSWGK